MKHFLLLLLVFFSVSSAFSQSPQITVYNPPLEYTQNNGDWGLDLLVSATEPMGRPSAVYQQSTGAVFVSIPDTNILANRCLVILRSTNNGNNWAVWASVQPATIVPKSKMVAKDDSVYCVFQFGSLVYVWNVITNSFKQFPTYTDIRDFDITISSTSSLYLIIDRAINNDVRIFGSADGGSTWPYANFLSSVGAFPKIYMSGTGDTCVINYYGVAIQPDTISSAIRSVRYRESVPGTLLINGSFSTPVPAGNPKPQMTAVKNNNFVWLFYSQGSTGSIDLYCAVSQDYGVSYGTPFTVGAMPSRDEYWFDAKHYPGGVDLIYYSDSLQSGAPSNQSDKLIYAYATNANSGTFQSFVNISQHPPGWSERGYIPTLFEYPSGDIGVIWVGYSNPGMKLYFDRLNAVSKISNNENIIPDSYTLKQNYPNPFNPQTTIEFSIPKNDFVSIKIFDVSGREISTLVSEQLTRGSYKVDFNGSNLSSGIYFYKLTVGNYTETRKMMLIK